MEIYEDIKDKPKIVFGYFVNEEFKGFRGDSWGNLSITHPKIYRYTKSQLETIRRNTKYELSKQGTIFFKELFNKGFTPINTESQILEKNKIIEGISKTEQEKRDWGQFDIKVFEFPYDYDDLEEWKIQAFI